MRVRPDQTPEPTAATALPSVADGLACVDSRKLLADSREILIAHGQELYHLRLTRQNRLILTK